MIFKSLHDLADYIEGLERETQDRTGNITAASRAALQRAAAVIRSSEIIPDIENREPTP